MRTTVLPLTLSLTCLYGSCVPGQDLCPPLPTLHCAIVFDSHDCSGGWFLTVDDGQRMAFDGIIFSTSWWFRYSKLL